MSEGITLTVAELKRRHDGGQQFRLRSVPFWQPSDPDKQGGQWPAIVSVDSGTYGKLGTIYVVLERICYPAEPGDEVKVIPN